ncbi:MAG: hypothetical protein DRO18_05955, partial [Thermoprotei archaeon]
MKTFKYLIVIALISLILITTYYILISPKYIKQESTIPPLITNTSLIGKEELNLFLNVSPIYRELGYPKISKGFINISVYYQYSGESPFTYRLGYLEVNVLSLNDVIKSVAKELGLDPSKYKLVSASLSSGIVINGEVRERPEWILNFVRTYGGYWLWGCYTYYSHIEVRVDALNGTIVSIAKCDEELPPKGFIPKLNINMSKALSIVRSLPKLKDKLNLTIPEDGWEVIEEGKVFWIDLRLAKLGPGAKNYYLEKVINPKYAGKYGLFWVIALYGDTNYVARRVVALVNAKTGDVVTVTYSSMIRTPWLTVFIEPNFTSIEGAKVRAFKLNVSSELISQLGVSKATLVIPNVTVLEPGTEGSIELIVKPHDIDQDLVGNIVVMNPIPTQSIPQELVFTPLKGILIKNGGLTKVRLRIKAVKGCPEGTWLIKVKLITHRINDKSKYIE